MLNKSHILISMILRNEGGYWMDPDNLDSGGETYCGISRVNFPKWEGWKIIDKFKPLKREQIITTVKELEDLVEQFYADQFYNKCKIDDISNIYISAHLLDHSVNAGVSNGVKCLQKAILNLGHSLDVDGKIGPTTIRLANLCNSKNLLQEFISKRKEYYQEIVDRKPSQNKFLKGWLNRVDEVNIYVSNKFS